LKALRKLIVILGIPIDDIDMQEALDHLDGLIQMGRASGNGHQVVTVNVDFIVNALRDPDLLSILRDSSLATADGMPLVWGARFLGAPLKERVAGADLVPALAERAAQNGYSLFLLGAAPGVAAKAAEILQQRYPGLKIAGVYSPPFQPGMDTDPSTIEMIREKKPDILMVALGNPKQEKWIHRYGSQLSVPLMMGVGGSLDFLAGVTKRAPQWMQRSGFEWVWRLSQEPRRLWRRYVVGLAVFGLFFARQWWNMRRGSSPSQLFPTTDLILVENTAIINVQGRLTVSHLPAFRQIGQQALALSSHLIVNLGQAEFLDSSAIGALVELAKLSCNAGGELALAATPQDIRFTFSLLRLDTYFPMFSDLYDALSARVVRKDTRSWLRQPARG
jgi:N-acetylglucosaminyldiphosphoundecaprenol N-acetyl-beta-D-mannosaminyltransferase